MISLTTAATALLLVLQPAAPVLALSATNVCSFTTGQLYVRDALQTAFPPGFLSCVGADGKAIARCASCLCRDKQVGTTSGLSVEWGLCVESTDACVTAQPPDRQYCGNVTESERAVFEAGTVTGANTDTGAMFAPVATSPTNVEELGSTATISNGASNSKSSANTYIVSGCAVAGVAAIAMFTVSRKRQIDARERALGTPAHSIDDDLEPAAYGPTHTSKAKALGKPKLSASTAAYKNRLSERMTGESILSDSAFEPAHPIALPVQQTGSNGGRNAPYKPQPQQQRPVEMRSTVDSVGARDSSFFGFGDDADDRFTIEDGSMLESKGFATLAYGKTFRNKTTTAPAAAAAPFDASFVSVEDLNASSASTNFSVSGISTFDATTRDTSLSLESDSNLSLYDRDTAASEFLRGSDDSIVFGTSVVNASALSFYAEDHRSESSRKSIEF